jgi:hypothetical protein
MFNTLCHAVDSFVGFGEECPKKSPAGAACRSGREAVSAFALWALRALIAAADTASQNQQAKNLQNGCCTNAIFRDASTLAPAIGLSGRMQIMAGALRRLQIEARPYLPR